MAAFSPTRSASILPAEFLESAICRETCFFCAQVHGVASVLSGLDKFGCVFWVFSDVIDFPERGWVVMQAFGLKCVHQRISEPSHRVCCPDATGFEKEFVANAQADVYAFAVSGDFHSFPP